MLAGTQGLFRRGTPCRGLVAAGALTRERAENVAHRIHASSPLHINERVLAGFSSALDALVLI